MTICRCVLGFEFLRFICFMFMTFVFELLLLNFYYKHVHLSRGITDLLTYLLTYLLSYLPNDYRRNISRESGRHLPKNGR